MRYSKRERGKNIRVKNKIWREKWKAKAKSFISACSSQRGNPTIVCYQLRFPAPIFSSSFFSPPKERKRKRVELLFLPLPLFPFFFLYPVIHLSFFSFLSLLYYCFLSLFSIVISFLYFCVHCSSLPGVGGSLVDRGAEHLSPSSASNVVLLRYPPTLWRI